MPEPLSAGEQKEIEEYRLIFTEFPELQTLARSYWNRTSQIIEQEDAAEKEQVILTDVVREMTDILLNNTLFEKAMSRVGADRMKNAIMESLKMIDIVPLIDNIEF